MVADNSLAMAGSYSAHATCSRIHAEGAKVLATYTSTTWRQLRR